MNGHDVIVVGLGHAGCEAALACARMGASTLGVTLKADRIAVMSCNPAIGGTAKGHLVRELDALGGEMAHAADQAGTHFVTLNASKGPAVRATRVLCDRDAYARTMQAAVGAQPGLAVTEGEVSELVVHEGRVVGVRMGDGRELMARCVVVTTGTFLQALMHLGEQKSIGGRLGDAAATGLSGSLRALGFQLGRFKTGTPARLLRQSIDWEACDRQPGHAQPLPVSLKTARAPFPLQPQLSCGVTFTNEGTHRILRENLHRSPLYKGDIVGRGPRYCPSLEDKVVRFADKARHTVFLEPEGPQSELVYPAGLSTSMPAEVQLEFLRTLRGLEHVEVARYGYAVEYDFAPPTQLKATLETRAVRGLFFAGQLNGTSGYEEAAFQGLLAGINAALQVRGEEPLVLARHEAHGAVLLDELTTRGVDEPFRMFTARSEHRLRLREGNADLRLRAHGHRVGLVSAAEVAATEQRRARIAAELERLEKGQLLPLLRRPEVSYASLVPASPLPSVDQDEVETEAKYAGYIAQAEAAWFRRSEESDAWRIPSSFRFAEVRGLSTEATERLEKARPETVGHAKRLPGMTPAAVGLLLVHLKRTGLFHGERPSEG
ncbi:MAG: tRNA uridine-5-carboxymethylaminomethyl(34) synthesis enzyme MnmG [Archangiaceae bacterium]|nr:tRNA uridine-5-carboxymethylaminomethyl(34) synthesis enzyme MnmG [Archangiaceae bacterium]